VHRFRIPASSRQQLFLPTYWALHKTFYHTIRILP
jgi:hypothetical protein